MIIIYTRAYNAEQTLRTTIESVLNQSYTDFQYLILDNGSTDNTKDIIQEYAKVDKRIIIFSHENNILNFSSCLGLLKFAAYNYSDDDYLCNIDADDVYHFDFMENMINFVYKNELDMAFCGINVLEKETGNLLRCKKLDKDLIMENEDLPKHFLSFRSYTTDMWGKFFKLDLLKYYLLDARFLYLKLFNHSQQSFIYDALTNSTKVGILAKELIDYYESNASYINTRTNGQMPVSLHHHLSIFSIMERFIEKYSKSNKYYKRNISYAYAIYCGYIKSSFEVIKLTNAWSVSNKISFLSETFSNHTTQEMLYMKADNTFYSLVHEEKEKLCNDVIAYCLSIVKNNTHRVKVKKIMEYMRNCGMAIDASVEAILKENLEN